ncbi:hypothetical protein Axi01nite_18280 [Actinoplanes xinjiangensis]|nr:hypothetical protein Axi01nite_18280 [Actinoplanes xinjiangensis]
MRIQVNGRQIRYYSDDRLVFDHTDADPYPGGWFAFRTVASHFHIEDFTVWRPPVT